MLKSLAGFLLVLVASGVALSLYLPGYSSGEGNSRFEKVNYQIITETIRKPLKMDLMLFDTDSQNEHQFGLRLGIYSQLEQAIQVANNNKSLTALTIFKAEDNDNSWYIIAKGPYQQESQAEGQKQQIPSQLELTKTVIVWPLEKKEAKK